MRVRKRVGLQSPEEENVFGIETYHNWPYLAATITGFFVMSLTGYTLVIYKIGLKTPRAIIGIIVASAFAGTLAFAFIYLLRWWAPVVVGVVYLLLALAYNSWCPTQWKK